MIIKNSEYKDYNKILEHYYTEEYKEFAENNPEYIDIQDDKIIFLYSNPPKSKDIYYKDIDKLEVIINTCIYRGHSAHDGLNMNISIGSESYSINYKPIDLNVLYKIIYCSQYAKSFSYDFTGNGEQTKETLKKVIDDYIKNDYKKTALTLFYTPINPFILTAICLAIMGVFLLFVNSLFHI